MIVQIVEEPILYERVRLVSRPERDTETVSRNPTNEMSNPVKNRIKRFYTDISLAVKHQEVSTSLMLLKKVSRLMSTNQL